jgi:heme/copper-type cytochrome/quinol oxidase subunit 2
MSFDEKGTWITLVLMVVVPAAYAAYLLGQVGETPVAEISYVGPMIIAIGVTVVAAIVAHIVVAVARPSEADKRDARDREINRFGEYVGATVLGVAVIGVLALTMAEVAYFWIGNALYLALTLQAVSSSAVKLVAYRRGL